MDHALTSTSADSPPLSAISSADLVKSLIADGGRLIEQQFTLVQLESERQLQREKSALMAAALGAVLLLLAVGTLIVAAIAALGAQLGGHYAWAALIVGGALLVVATPAALWAWSKRVVVALPASRAVLAKELKWLKSKTL